MDLYFIRHGEAITATLDPKGPDRLLVIDRYGSGSYQGGLTEKGRRQAEAAAEFLAGKNISRIYTSPLPRAVQTAEYASRKLGLPSVPCPELKEILIGYLRPGQDRVARVKMEAGLLVNDVYSRISGNPVFAPVALYFMFLYMTGWLRGQTHDAETPAEVRRRILDLLERVANELEPDGAAALFSHGYLIYFLINHVLEPERRWVHLLKHPYIRNASVTHITGHDGAWRVRGYADRGQAHGDPGLGHT